jgi:phosphate starvation-inducible PhoH-like protein
MSSKKNRRIQRGENVGSHFDLKQIVPLTRNQQNTFKAFYDGKHLLLHGVAGTGKTFVSLFLALEEILNQRNYSKVIIIRSVVPSRDIGFLPGNAKEKSRIYEEPYKEICDTLFNRGDGYECLKSKNLIEFTTTSFLRGLTFNDAIVIVDETQNMTIQELDTVMTRVGENCRIIFCGDYMQSDLEKKEERKGLLTFMTILDTMNLFARVEFTKEDIVRSDLVKRYIIAKLELGIS